MAKNYRYSGILNRPMSLPDPNNAVAIALGRKTMLAEYQDRIGALMLNCAVASDSRDKWMDLAFALAERHVPGFSFEGPYTPQRKRELRDLQIYIHMSRLCRDGQSQRNAARIVASKMNRKRDGLKEVTEDSLETLYRRIKKSLDK